MLPESSYAEVNRRLAKLIGVIISSTTIAAAFNFRIVSRKKEGEKFEI